MGRLMTGTSWRESTETWRKVEHMTLRECARAARFWAVVLAMGAAGPVLAQSAGGAAGKAQQDRSALSADEPAWVLSIAGGLAQGPSAIPVAVQLGSVVPIRLEGQALIDRGQAVTASLSRQFWGSESDDRQSRYPMRLELEGLWADVQRQRLNVGVASATLSDQVDVQGLFANGLVRLIKTEHTQWWLGAGVGRIRQSVPDASAALPGCGCLKAMDGDGTTWRAKLRLEVPLRKEADDGSAVFVEGAYSPIPALTSGSAAPVTTYQSWGLRSLTVGWRIRF